MLCWSRVAAKKQGFEDVGVDTNPLAWFEQLLDRIRPRIGEKRDDMPPKPKLLCLHGLEANSEVTEAQVNTVLGLDSVASCYFIDAPHLAEKKYDKAMTDDGRDWVGSDGELGPGLDLVVEYCKKHGPFDGVYGFSQGCSILAILSDPGVLKARGIDTPLWRFAICVCGSYYLVEKQKEPAVQLPIALPSFHMLGETDDTLPKSKTLLARFDRPHVVMHPWGHSVPMALFTTHTHLVAPLIEFVKAPGHSNARISAAAAANTDGAAIAAATIDAETV